MPRSCGPRRLGIISAQCNNCAALGWGLLWREPGPARPRGSPFVVGALVLITSIISTVFIGSPSLLQAWSPCSLLQALLCWGFSKFPSCRLRQSWLSGWALTFVTGLLKMQLVSLIGCSVLSQHLRLLMATTNCLFFAKVSGMMLLRNLPREGWIVSVIDPGSSMAAELCCWATPDMQTACGLLQTAYICVLIFLSILDCKDRDYLCCTGLIILL